LCPLPLLPEEKVPVMERTGAVAGTVEYKPGAFLSKPRYWQKASAAACPHLLPFWAHASTPYPSTFRVPEHLHNTQQISLTREHYPQLLGSRLCCKGVDVNRGFEHIAKVWVRQDSSLCNSGSPLIAQKQNHWQDRMPTMQSNRNAPIQAKAGVIL